MSLTGSEINFKPILNGQIETPGIRGIRKEHPHTTNSHYERTPETDAFEQSSKDKCYKHKHPSKTMRQKQIAIRLAAFAAAIAALGGTLTAANTGASHQDKIAIESAATNYVDSETGIVSHDLEELDKEQSTISNSSKEENSKTDKTSYKNTTSDKDTVEIISDDDTIKNIQSLDKNDNVKASSTSKAQIDKLNEIFEADPNAKRAFDDIEIALKRASFEFKENAVDVLKRTQEKYAPNLPLALLLCVMEQENGGYARDWDNGKYVIGPDGDAGAFQITPICEEEANTKMNTPEIDKKLGSSRDGETLDRFNVLDNAKIAAVKLACDYDYFNGDIRKTLFAYNAGRYAAEKSDNSNAMGPYVGSVYAAHLAYFENNPEMLEYILTQDYSKPSPKDGIDHVLISDYTGKALYDYNNMSYDPNKPYTPYKGLNVSGEIY